MNVTPKPSVVTPPELRFSRLPARLPCPVCAAADGVAFASSYPSQARKFSLAVLLFCDRCGSGHVPDADSLIENYYEREYGKQGRYNRGVDPAAFFVESGEGTVARYLARADAQIAELKSVGAAFDDVLDYGAGHGVFLWRANARRSFAVERDPECRKYLDHLKARVVEEAALPRGAFDVIVASHVVEHLTATTLRPTLEQLYAALKPGGHFLVEVPHGGLSYVLKPRPQHPHTLFFTPQALSGLLAGLGGEIVYEGTKGRNHMPLRPNACFTPPGAPESFATTRREGLTVIVRRA